jgi:hypothetical protein
MRPWPRADRRAGGFDATPIPNTPTGYTLRITFHSATNVRYTEVRLNADIV